MESTLLKKQKVTSQYSFNKNFKAANHEAKSSVVHFQTRKSNQAQTILNLYSDENIRESEVKVKFIYICLKQQSWSQRSTFKIYNLKKSKMLNPEKVRTANNIKIKLNKK